MIGLAAPQKAPTSCMHQADFSVCLVSTRIQQSESRHPRCSSWLMIAPGGIWSSSLQIESNSSRFNCSVSSSISLLLLLGYDINIFLAPIKPSSRSLPFESTQITDSPLGGAA